MAQSGWRHVARGVLQGSVLSPVLFNLFISIWMKWDSKFAYVTKLGGVVDTGEGCAAVQ